jgi:hypothetical protein
MGLSEGFEVAKEMTVPVTDDQVATLRAHLAGDFDEHDRLHAQLDPVAASTGYSALISAAFVEAVERRFTKSSPASDVIEFVGGLRERSDRLAEEIDPRIAERMIRAVYTDEEIDDIDDRASFSTQFLLLTGLIVDEGLDDAGLDKILADARKLADQWVD